MIEDKEYAQNKKTAPLAGGFSHYSYLSAVLRLFGDEPLLYH